MLLENSQLIIEVVLTIVIVAGIISSRLIVKRLSVIRETYAALDEMVANLDTSTDHVGRVFDSMKHEANKGGKRLNSLVEHARNAGEDLTDLQKMAREVTAELEQDVMKAEAKKDSLVKAIRDAEKTLELLESRASFYKDVPTPEALKAQYEEILEEAEERAREAFVSSLPDITHEDTSASMTPEVMEPEASSDSMEENSEISGSQFHDNLDQRSLLQALRSPRPYMKKMDDKK